MDARLMVVVPSPQSNCGTFRDINCGNVGQALGVRPAAHVVGILGPRPEPSQLYTESRLMGPESGKKNKILEPNKNTDVMMPKGMESLPKSQWVLGNVEGWYINLNLWFFTDIRGMNSCASEGVARAMRRYS